MTNAPRAAPIPDFHNFIRSRLSPKPKKSPVPWVEARIFVGRLSDFAAAKPFYLWLMKKTRVILSRHCLLEAFLIEAQKVGPIFSHFAKNLAVYMQTQKFICEFLARRGVAVAYRVMAVEKLSLTFPKAFPGLLQMVGERVY